MTRGRYNSTKFIKAETDRPRRQNEANATNKPALDQHPNIDGFMFMELHTYTVGSEMWPTLCGLHFYLNCKGQNHNMGKVMFRRQNE